MCVYEADIEALVQDGDGTPCAGVRVYGHPFTQVTPLRRLRKSYGGEARTAQRRAAGGPRWDRGDYVKVYREGNLAFFNYYSVPFLFYLFYQVDSVRRAKSGRSSTTTRGIFTRASRSGKSPRGVSEWPPPSCRRAQAGRPGRSSTTRPRTSALTASGG